MRKRSADIVSTNSGSIIAITAASRKGRRWMSDHVLADGRGETVYCEHRYGIDILQGALAAGLRLRDSMTGRIAVQA